MIIHLHSSSRFDRSADSLARAMRRYVRHSNLITLTETQKKVRVSEALNQPGWTVTKFYGPGDGDPTVVSKDDDWEVLTKWDKQVTKHRQRRGGGGPPPAHALTVLLKNKHNDKKLLVSVLHTTSHVEGDWFKSGPFGGRVWRVMVWLDSVRHWKRFVNRLRRHHKAKVMFVADWNINFKRWVFRALVKSLFPVLHLTWRKPFPADGTHHSRVIDATVTNLKVRREAELFRDDNSSDHRPYIETLDW